MPKVTWTALTYFVLAEMHSTAEEGEDVSVHGELVERVLKAFGGLTHGGRDPDLFLINSFHDLAEREAHRVKRGPAPRKSRAADKREMQRD